MTAKTAIVLHGGPYGGEIVETVTPTEGHRFILPDLSRPTRNLVYEIRLEYDDETDETRIFAAYTGVESKPKDKSV